MNSSQRSTVHSHWKSSAVAAALGAFSLVLFAAAAAGIVPSPSDPWKADQIVEPRELAAALSADRGPGPEVVCVGMPFLYRSAHIPGAKLLGPALSPEGLDSLKKWAQGVPRESAIVLYCGCCPWADCPNLRPAFQTLQGMGFSNLKVLHLPHSFKLDWSDQGYSVQKSK